MVTKVALTADGPKQVTEAAHELARLAGELKNRIPQFNVGASYRSAFRGDVPWPWGGVPRAAYAFKETA